MEEQHRLRVNAKWQSGLNASKPTNATNATDHVDDFIARIDKLTQVGTVLQS